MTIRHTGDPENVYIGRGEALIDVLVNGAKTGAFTAGPVDVFEDTITDETLELLDKRYAEAPLYVSVMKQRAVDLTIKGYELGSRILELITMGTGSDLTQTGGAIVDEQVIASALQGCWYDVSKRSLSNVTVKAGTAGAEGAVDLTDDYLVDEERGRIYIVPGGGIADGDSVLVSATAAEIAAGSLRKILGATRTTIEAQITFLGDPSHGPAMEKRYWRVSIRPDGATGLISDEFYSWQLKGKTLSAKATHPTCPYFELIEPAVNAASGDDES